MVLTLALVRHGQTEWNARGLIQGSSDIPLNAAGRAQARAAAATVCALGGPAPWQAVVTSPLRRAVQTGQFIALALEVPVLPPVAGLRERDYGVGEGKTDSWAEAHFPDWNFPGAESRAGVLTRARDAMVDLAAWAQAQEPAMTHLVAVAHGGVIQSLLADITGGPVADIANGAATLVRVDRGVLLLG